MRSPRLLAALVVALTGMASCSSSSSPEEDEETTATSVAAVESSTGSVIQILEIEPIDGGAAIEIGFGAADIGRQIHLDVRPRQAGAPWQTAEERVRVEVVGSGERTLFVSFQSGEVVPMRIGIPDRAPEVAYGGRLSPASFLVEVGNERVVNGGVGESDSLTGATPPAEALGVEDWTLVGDGEQIPIDIEIRTDAHSSGRTVDGELVLATRHRIVVRSSEALLSGDEYTLDLGDQTLVFTPSEFDVSPSLHLSDIGVSTRGADVLIGSDLLVAGDLQPEGLEVVWFDADGVEVDRSIVDASPVDDANPRVAEGFAGPTGLASIRDVGASSIRGCVPDLGCSELVRVSDDVWRDALVDVARGLYHQRSGIALEAPTTSFTRPRAYHPDDGLTVRSSGYSLLDALQQSEAEIFEGLVAGASDTPADGAYGGHFDAGDWDRRAQHLWMVRYLADVVEVFPAAAEINLGIPESGDGIPDLLDEALWTLDAFTRMQSADGAVRGGIEASDHPVTGSLSWTETLDVFAYAPDPWTSFVYAGVAADMARAIEPYDPSKAEALRGSAVAAWDWAEVQEVDVSEADLVATQRAVAGASLFTVTDDPAHHDAFAMAYPYVDTTPVSLGCHGADWCDASWTYLKLDVSKQDPVLAAAAKAALIQTGATSAGLARSSTSGWTIEHPEVPLVWGLGLGGNPNVIGLVRGASLAEDETWWRLAERAAANSVGLNVLGRSFITGIGDGPRSPLIVDVLNGGSDVWPGTPVFGVHAVGDYADEGWLDTFFLAENDVSPLMSERPYTTRFVDVADFAPMNEFTVFQSHGPTILGFGYLAFRE